MSNDRYSSYRHRSFSPQSLVLVAVMAGQKPLCLLAIVAFVVQMRGASCEAILNYGNLTVLDDSEKMARYYYANVLLTSTCVVVGTINFCMQCRSNEKASTPTRSQGTQTMDDAKALVEPELIVTARGDCVHVRDRLTGRCGVAVPRTVRWCLHCMRGARVVVE